MRVRRDNVFTFGRDPFARFDRVRVGNQDAGGWSKDCCWCGQTPRNLYCYGTWPDAGAPYVDEKHAFCNVQCCDNYHGRQQ